MFLQIVSQMLFFFYHICLLKHHKCQTRTPKYQNKSLKHITTHFEELEQTFSQLSDI